MPDRSAYEKYMDENFPGWDKSGGSTASSTTTAPATAKPTFTTPPLPAYLAQNGYVQLPDGEAVNPRAIIGVGRNQYAGPAKAYYDTSTKAWVDGVKISPEQYRIAQGQLGSAPAAQTTPATAQLGTATTPPVQTQPSTSRTLYTPGPRDQQNIAVPGSYQNGPSGFTSQNPNIAGQGGAYFTPYSLQFSPSAQPTQSSQPSQAAYQQARSAPTSPWEQFSGLRTSPGQGAPPQPVPPSAPPLSPSGGGTPVVSGQVSTQPVAAQTQPTSQLAPDRQAFINAMYPTALAWSEKTGIPPEYYLAMNGSESNFGAANSLFGVKGSGNAGSDNYATHEVVNGQNVGINDQFAKYSDPNAAYEGFHNFLSQNSRYAPALAQYEQDKNPEALLQNINKAGYATDPNWATMISGMARDIRGALPTTPAPAPVPNETVPSSFGTTGSGPSAVLPNRNMGLNFDALTQMLKGAQPNDAARIASNAQISQNLSAQNLAGFALPNIAPQPSPSTIYMSGPQTAHLGSMSQGYNPVEILRGHPEVKPTGDSATDAVLAARIMQAPGYGGGDPLTPSMNQGSHGYFQGDKSGQLENVTRTGYGYFFSPGNAESSPTRNSPMSAYSPVTTPQGVTIPFSPGASEAAKAQYIGYTGNPTSNVGAALDTSRYVADNPNGLNQYANTAGLPPQQEMLAIAQAERDREAEQAAGNAGMYGADGPTRGYAQGGSFSTPPPTTGWRSGAGGISIDDRQGIHINDHSGTRFSAGHASPGSTSMPSAAYVTTRPTLFPMQGGGTAVTSEYGQPELVNQQGSRVNVTPMHGYASGGQFSTPTNPIPGIDPPGSTPINPGPGGGGLNQPSNQNNSNLPFANDTTAPRQQALDTSPEVAVQQQLAAQQHARDNTAYQYREAGMAQPTGIVSAQNPGQLGLGQYWQPIDYTGQIQGLQGKLQSYGQTGDPNSLLTQLNQYKSQLDPLTQAQSLQTKLQGYGNVGDPNSYVQQLTDYNQRMNQLNQGLDRYNQAQSLQTKLTGLGAPGDLNALLSQRQALQSQMDRYNQAQGISTKLAGLGQAGDPAALESQLNTLNQQLAPLQAIQKNQLELKALGNVPDQSVTAANLAGIERQIANNQTLIQQAQAGSDPNLGAGGWTTAQLIDLDTQLKNSLAQAQQQHAQAQTAAQRRTEITNLLGGNTEDVSSQIGTLGSQISALQQQQSNTQNSADLRNQYTNQLQSLGIDPTADLSGLIGGLQSQLSPLNSQITNTQSTADLRSQLQNQLAGLGDTSGDFSGGMAALQAQKTLAETGLSNSQQAQQLRAQIAALHPGGGDINSELAGLQSNVDQTQTAYGNAQNAQTLEQQIAALRGGQGGVATSPKVQQVASSVPAAAPHLASVMQSLSDNNWTPQSSDSLVNLTQALKGKDDQGLLQQIVAQISGSRPPPPGMGQAAYSNPIALAAATKFQSAPAAPSPAFA